MTAEVNYVYIIGAKESPLVKIGTTDNVKRRLREIQNMCPVKLRVLWQTVGNEQLERALHRRFRPWRKHGEWFDLSDPVAAVQKALSDPSLLIKPVRETPFKSARPAAPYTGSKVVLQSSWKPPQRLTGQAARVYQVLRERIASGELPVGTPLPPSGDLAHLYKVPAITVSSAVKCLEAQGVVVWPQFQPPVVQRIPEGAPE